MRAMGLPLLSRPAPENPYFPVTFALEHCPHAARPRARTAVTINKPFCNILEIICNPLFCLRRRLEEIAGKRKREWMLATGFAGVKNDVLLWSKSMRLM